MTRAALVTGATGGLGRHLVPKLLALGYEVLATGRNAVVGAELSRLGAKFQRGDLRDPNHVTWIVEHADVVFHCAALSAAFGPYRDFYENNVVATTLLCAGAARAGCRRFVHISSSSVYFRLADQFGIREDAPLPERFVNHYAATKAAADGVVAQAAGDGFSTVILRPRGLFGEYDTVILPRLLRLAERGFIPLPRAGAAVVDVTYLGNLADAMILAGSSDADGVFNITNCQPLTVAELTAMIVKAMQIKARAISVPYGLMRALAAIADGVAGLTGREPKLTRYSVGLLNFNQTLDITRARSVLGYSPAVSVSEGLARYAAWCAGGGVQ
jgi:nucleoside-diphosphate-sugar epimerase